MSGGTAQGFAENCASSIVRPIAFAVMDGSAGLSNRSSRIDR
jgi:hypothetical protein